MASVSKSPISIAALFLAVCLLWVSNVSAQEQAPLPDYVLEQYGAPPNIPDEDLSAAMEYAVRVAFQDSVVQKSWGPDQSLALAEIAKSGDPRLVWIISDLMRFAQGPNLNAELASAASQFAGQRYFRPKRLGHYQPTI